LHRASCPFAGLISSVSLHVFLRRENAARERGERDEVIGEKAGGDPETEARARKNGAFASVADAKREKGDGWSGYRYVV
jgi:hypothetical protein